MAEADISAITYFAPIAAFLIVFIISYAILAKTKLLGESKFINIFLSLFIGAIFVSAAGSITYIRTLVPWVAVLLVSTALILMLTGLVGKPAEGLNKGIGLVVVIVFGLIALVSAFFVFSGVIVPYLPGPAFGSGGNTEATLALDWLYSPRIAGAGLLIIISAAVAWVLVKGK